MSRCADLTLKYSGSFDVKECPMHEQIQLTLKHKPVSSWQYDMWARPSLALKYIGIVVCTVALS